MLINETSHDFPSLFFFNLQWPWQLNNEKIGKSHPNEKPMLENLSIRNISDFPLNGSIQMQPVAGIINLTHPALGETLRRLKGQ